MALLASSSFAFAQQTFSSVTIQTYSPLLYLKRDTNQGGYIQGIQSQQVDGTNNWFMGNMGENLWGVSKGDYQNPAFGVNSDGNVRIGAVTDTGNSALRIYRNENTLVEIVNSLGRFQMFKSSCAGCGASDALPGDTVLRNLGQTQNIILGISNNSNDGLSYIGIGDGYHGTWIKFQNNGIAKFDGKIYAKEVEVKANVWADYVFKKDYKLNSLEEVEKHIEEKGHLPNIPSAEEVAKVGINLGEMDAKLLEKIEELTLYSIEQNKALKQQSEKIEKLEKQLELLLSIKK